MPHLGVGSGSVPAPAVGDLVALPLPRGRWALVWVAHHEAEWTRVYLMQGSWSGTPTQFPALAASIRTSSHGIRPSDFLPGAPDLVKLSVRGRFRPEAVTVATRELDDLAREWAKSPLLAATCGSYAALTKEIASILDADTCGPRPEQAPLPPRPKAKKPKSVATLAQVARQPVFPKWERMHPRALVRQARAIVTEAMRQLRSLQATGTPAKRRAVLRRVVSEFNRLDRRASFIDTSEAEQIVAWVEALAAAVGLDNDEERLTGHRDW